MGQQESCFVNEVEHEWIYRKKPTVEQVFKLIDQAEDGFIDKAKINAFANIVGDQDLPSRDMGFIMQHREPGERHVTMQAFKQWWTTDETQASRTYRRMVMRYICEESWPPGYEKWRQLSFEVDRLATRLESILELCLVDHSRWGEGSSRPISYLVQELKRRDCRLAVFESRKCRKIRREVRVARVRVYREEWRQMDTCDDGVHSRAVLVETYRKKSSAAWFTKQFKLLLAPLKTAEDPEQGVKRALEDQLGLRQSQHLGISLVSAGHHDELTKMVDTSDRYPGLPLMTTVVDMVAYVHGLPTHPFKTVESHWFSGEMVDHYWEYMDEARADRMFFAKKRLGLDLGNVQNVALQISDMPDEEASEKRSRDGESQSDDGSYETASGSSMESLTTDDETDPDGSKIGTSNHSKAASPCPPQLPSAEATEAVNFLLGIKPAEEKLLYLLKDWDGSPGRSHEAEGRKNLVRKYCISCGWDLDVVTVQPLFVAPNGASFLHVRSSELLSALSVIIKIDNFKNITQEMDAFQKFASLLGQEGPLVARTFAPGAKKVSVQESTVAKPSPEEGNSSSNTNSGAENKKGWVQDVAPLAQAAIEDDNNEYYDDDFEVDAPTSPQKPKDPENVPSSPLPAQPSGQWPNRGPPAMFVFELSDPRWFLIQNFLDLEYHDGILCCSARHAFDEELKLIEDGAPNHVVQYGNMSIVSAKLALTETVREILDVARGMSFRFEERNLLEMFDIERLINQFVFLNVPESHRMKSKSNTKPEILKKLKKIGINLKIHFEHFLERLHMHWDFFKREYPTCIGHGNMKLENIIIDGKQRIWLVDYARSGRFHALRDIARLETCLLFETSSISDSDEDFENAMRMIQILSRCGDKYSKHAAALPSKMRHVFDMIMNLREAVKNYVVPKHERGAKRKAKEDDPSLEGADFKPVRGPKMGTWDPELSLQYSVAMFSQAIHVMGFKETATLEKARLPAVAVLEYGDRIEEYMWNSTDGADQQPKPRRTFTLFPQVAPNNPAPEPSPKKKSPGLIRSVEGAAAKILSIERCRQQFFKMTLAEHSMLFDPTAGMYRDTLESLSVVKVLTNKMRNILVQRNTLRDMDEIANDLEEISRESIEEDYLAANPFNPDEDDEGEYVEKMEKEVEKRNENRIAQDSIDMLQFVTDSLPLQKRIGEAENKKPSPPKAAAASPRVARKAAGGGNTAANDVDITYEIPSHVLLLGTVPSGKSTIMRKLCVLSMIGQDVLSAHPAVFRGPKSARVPLFVRAVDLVETVAATSPDSMSETAAWDRDLLDLYIRNKYGRNSDVSRFWQHARQTHRILLLLDGLDEVGERHRQLLLMYIRAKFHRHSHANGCYAPGGGGGGMRLKCSLQPNEHQVVVSMRPHEMNAFYKMFEDWTWSLIMPLTYDMQKLYLTETMECPESRVHDLLKQVRLPEVISLSRTPILLSLLAKHYKRTNFKPLPNKKAQLYEELMDLIMNWYEGRKKHARPGEVITERSIVPEVRACRDILQNIAYQTLCRKRTEDITSDYAREVDDKWVKNLQGRERQISAKAVWYEMNSALRSKTANKVHMGVKRVWKHVETCIMHGNIPLLPLVSLKRTSRNQYDLTFRFAHSSFQQYFAARYIVAELHALYGAVHSTMGRDIDADSTGDPGRISDLSAISDSRNSNLLSAARMASVSIIRRKSTGTRRGSSNIIDEAGALLDERARALLSVEKDFDMFYLDNYSSMIEMMAGLLHGGMFVYIICLIHQKLDDEKWLKAMDTLLRARKQQGLREIMHLFRKRNETVANVARKIRKSEIDIDPESAVMDPIIRSLQRVLANASYICGEIMDRVMDLHNRNIQRGDVNWKPTVKIRTGPDSFAHVPLTMILPSGGSQIDTLSLDGCNFFREHPLATTYLAQGLVRNVQLKNLSLSDLGINAYGATALAKALQHNNTIESLDISHNFIGNDGACALGPALYSNVTIKSLDVSSCALSAGGAIYLAKVLDVNNFMTNINLNWNPVGDPGVGVLARYVRHNPTIKSLSIRGAGIAGSGANAIAEMLSMNRSLTVVDIGHNDIGLYENSVIAIFAALKDNESVEEFNVENNKITEKGISSLGAVLPFNSKLRMLHLGSNNMGIGGLTAIADGMRLNRTLQTINIWRNGINMEQAKDTIQVLRQHPTLKNVHTHEPRHDDAGRDVPRFMSKKN